MGTQNINLFFTKQKNIYENLKAHSLVWNQNDEIAFHFTLKLLLFSRYLSFCLDFLVMQKNSLIREIWLISKLMTPQLG